MSDQTAGCPRCEGTMDANSLDAQTHEAQIEVQRCSDCGGIFCNSETFELLLSTDGAEALDTGAGNARGERSEVLSCIVCDEVMANYRFPEQPHIQIDRCVSCLSVFLDGGELSDMRRYTILDWFRDLPYRS